MYRKICRSIWCDEHFRELSTLERFYALYCLTSPQTNRIGLFSFSIALSAEDIGCSAEEARESMEQVSKTLGWIYDSAARVLFISTWWKYNLPNSPDAFKGMLNDISSLPETNLLEAFACSTRYIEKQSFMTEFHRALRRFGLRSFIADDSPEEEPLTAQRKSLSKRKRFRIFKRDNFTCTYCGSQSPDVVLHVDHILPVSRGGTNKEDNLVTACDSCNLGKGVVMLDAS